jgi:NAD(P)-dependent dehydrogenase (short-subunit alcohol dehydrogenase family)
MGAMHAEVMAREGAVVIGTDILDEQGLEVARRLKSDGLAVDYQHLDVSQSHEWTSVVAQAEASYGPINVLVNNAGVIGSMREAHEENESDWATTVAVNQTGVFLGMKHTVPSMRRAGGGSIINICSIWGVSGVAGYFSYQATKGAVRMMTRSAALSYAREGIRVNNVCPGLILTEMAIEEGEENNAALIAMTPMRRGAAPVEVSYGVVYLASDESSYVTGTELAIDGGYLAQ